MHMEEHEEKENSERWLISYADFITLLMAFFVVLYAMSQVDLKKFEKLKGSLSSAFAPREYASSVLGGGTGHLIGSGTGSVATPEKVKVEPEFEKVTRQVEQYKDRQGLQASIRVSYDERGMILQLADNVMFPPGSASLTPAAKQLLDVLAKVLADKPNHIRIEGHTDDVPIRTARYPSNWQLSTDRATNVIMYWLSKGALPPERLSAAGYGEYRPVVPNDTPEHRAMNRRVDVVILRESLTQYEPKSRVKPEEGARTREAAQQ
ncbi:MAG: flagellar motor protein MotB [Chitinophagales bacterium]